MAPLPCMLGSNSLHSSVPFDEDECKTKLQAIRDEFLAQPKPNPEGAISSFKDYLEPLVDVQEPVSVSSGLLLLPYYPNL